MTALSVQLAKGFESPNTTREIFCLSHFINSYSAREKILRNVYQKYDGSTLKSVNFYILRCL